jgi:hypothetical protein
VLFLLSASVLIAQTPRLTGTVLDPSGAVIPGVGVKVLQGTTPVRESKTNETGNFSFDLPAGDYRLEVTMDAFRPHQQNVRVTANMRPLRIPLAGPGGPMVVTAPQAGSNTPGPKLNFTVNAQNLLNNTQNRGYYGVLGSPLFGTSTGAAAGRTVSLGLGLTF